MKMRRIDLVLFLLAVVFSLSLAINNAQGSSYPERYIKFICASAPGGGFDTQSRILAPMLKKHLPNQSDVVVQNITGAGTMVGNLELMKAAPDGYTIGLVDTATLAVMQASGRLGNLDLRKNLVWLGRTEAPGFLIVAQKAGRFKSIRDIAGQQVRLGCTTQEAAQLVVLVKALGGKPLVTLYSGFAEIMPALRRNEIDLCMATYSSGLKFIASSEGELVPSLICRTDSRPELPNVPNLRNVGLESMVDVLGGDRLVAAPAGLSPDVQKILGDAILKATTDPEFILRMEKAGYLPAGGAEPAELKKLTSRMLDSITSSKDVWGPILIK